MQLTTTKERVLEAVEKDPQAKETLKTLFPEVFEDENEHQRSISAFADHINGDNGFPYSWYQAMPGDFSAMKARHMYENYIKPNMRK